MTRYRVIYTVALSSVGTPLYRRRDPLEPRFLIRVEIVPPADPLHIRPVRLARRAGDDLTLVTLRPPPSELESATRSMLRTMKNPPIQNRRLVT